MKKTQGDDVDLKQLKKHRLMLGVIYRLQALLLKLAGHNEIAWFYRTGYFPENTRRATGESSTCR